MQLVVFPVSCALPGGWQSQFFCSDSGTGEETATLKYPDPLLLPTRHRGGHSPFSAPGKALPCVPRVIEGIYRLS